MDRKPSLICVLFLHMSFYICLCIYVYARIYVSVYLYTHIRFSLAWLTLTRLNTTLGRVIPARASASSHPGVTVTSALGEAVALPLLSWIT